MNSVVYFIQRGTTDEVKIGVSRRLGARISSLASASGEPLTLLATIPGGRDEELALHRRFAAHRLRGEWFRMGGDLLSHIESIRSTTPMLPQRERVTITMPKPVRDRLLEMRARIVDMGDRLPEPFLTILRESQFAVDGRPKATIGLAVVLEMCMFVLERRIASVDPGFAAPPPPPARGKPRPR